MEENQGSQKEDKEPHEQSTPKGKPKLRVVATLGSITDVKVPVVVVGGYKGIAPTSALKTLDLALDQWITRAGDRGMIGGNLGEVFFVPVLDKKDRKDNNDGQSKKLAARFVLLAGMGEYGTFSYRNLCFLAMNICYAVSALRLKSFACVTIGSGEGNLEIRDALKGLLSGFCDALHHVEAAERVEEVWLVEYDKRRYAEIVKILKNLTDKKAIENIDIEVIPKTVRARKGKSDDDSGNDNSPGRPVSQFVNRITVERGEEDYCFSALTNSAVIPVRTVEVQPFFANGIATELKKGEDEKSHEKFGSLLHKYIFPEDFERIIDVGNSLTLVVDKNTAALPWEMACYGPKSRRTYFGLDLNLTRQFRTMLTGAPGIAPPINKSLRILVIADPAPDPDLRLEGALREGQRVVEILNAHKERLRGSVDVEIFPCLGPEQCKPLEILALILNETFDIVHYSGHGIFDAAKPNNSGWVFGRNLTLSAREIFRARQVPRLVFSNACFSAVCHGGEEDPPAEQTNRKLAGLAEAFFERGVQNYIGTGWAVDDAAALQFAEVFYEHAMNGKLLGQALAEARKSIFDLGSTWGAYQHYGQSGGRVVEVQAQS